MTISTASCVSARSGAENQTNVRQVTRPAPPIMISAASRWNLPCAAAPSAQAIPIAHSSTNSGEAGTRGRSPQPNSWPRVAATATASAVTTTSAICACRRRVPASSTARRASAVEAASTRTNARRPSSPPTAGMRA